MILYNTMSWEERMKTSPNGKRPVREQFGALEKTKGSLLKALVEEKKREMEREKRKLRRRKKAKDQGKPS